MYIDVIVHILLCEHGYAPLDICETFLHISGQGATAIRERRSFRGFFGLQCCSDGWCVASGIHVTQGCNKMINVIYLTCYSIYRG